MASWWPSWINWYKKPSYVDLKAFAASLNKKVEERHGEKSSPRDSLSSSRGEESIPKDLKLERVLMNRTCSPMSLYDFYMYLKHIEYSQENLEFYVWFKDYEKRHEHQTSQNSSRGKDIKAEVVSVAGSVESASSSTTAPGAVKGEQDPHTDLQASPEFTAYIEALVLHETARYPKPCFTRCCAATTCGTNDKLLTSAPPVNASELHQIAALFLYPLAPKELNIPPSLRKSALAAILTTSDSEPPEAHVLQSLGKIAEHTHTLLSHGSHRNFVRLGVNNGTFETLCMVTFVGITMTLAGFLTMLLLAFASPHVHGSPCWRGLATIPFWFIGLSFLLAGMRGSCFLLLLFSRRQELPWERIEGDDESARVKVLEVTSGDTSDQSGRSRGNLISRFARKLMIFERRIKVKDMGLRRLQRRIVMQSITGAVVGTAILEVFFLCLPIWKR